MTTFVIAPRPMPAGLTPEQAAEWIRADQQRMRTEIDGAVFAHVRAAQASLREKLGMTDYEKLLTTDSPA